MGSIFGQFCGCMSQVIYLFWRMYSVSQMDVIRPHP